MEETFRSRRLPSGIYFSQFSHNIGFAILHNHPIDFHLITSVYNEWGEFFNSDAKHSYTFNPDTQDGYFPYRSENAKGYPAKDLKEFDIKLKCWWSPNETDCFIHNEHPFLEVHTQIHGIGRMQKFRERDPSTVYEDVRMAPGFTHEPFCVVTGPNQWTYPWHRYYTDLESIWLAVELHPN